jgi:ABC-type sugar transport system ATPase subunit
VTPGSDTHAPTVGGPGAARPPAIRAVDISKQFGATRALDSVSLDLQDGTIHALVGENGAGKSTFLGVLAGRVAPTSGHAEVFGEEFAFGDPRFARRAGIVAIYQELTTIPAQPAYANVFLGQSRSRAGFLSTREMRQRFRELCGQFDVAIPADVPAGRLSVADQQMLEIMRGIEAKSRIIFFDEPTTALAVSERQALFRVMRQLQASGVTMMLVSHNLDEVLEIADAVTVFRDGRLEAHAPTADWTKRSLVRAMIGHDLPPPAAMRRSVPASESPPVLRVQDVTLPGALESVSLEVAAGEILGVGGLVGSGRSSLLRALAGLERRSTGQIWVDGRERTWSRSPRQSLGYGIALIPEDRKAQGLVLGLSAADNITMSDFSTVGRAGFISPRATRERARSVAKDYGFDVNRIDTVVRNLSGGNQQKVLLARWSHRAPKLLLADEPTRGIDVGAKDEILTTLRRLADEGLAIIVVSSELEEVTAISDRVVVLAQGRLVSTLEGEDVAVSRILHDAFEASAT